VLPFRKITIFFETIFPFFWSIIQHSVSSPRQNKYFSKPEKELPLVALFNQEKSLVFVFGLFTSVWASVFEKL
jgi:hypothetical protein